MNHKPTAIVMVTALFAATTFANHRVRVFVLAGQSNMEGQAVVDLAGQDYNNGRGTLESVLAEPSTKKLFGHLRGKDGRWAVRSDVWIAYQREERPLLAGPLGLGFSVYGDQHHFGPELQFGNVVGDGLSEPVVLIKTAWGGKSLYKDFRPPSSGGDVGRYYTMMIDQVRSGLSSVTQLFPKLKGLRCELSGLVWYQGWNDGVDPEHAVPEYGQNLTNLIKDFRKEFRAPHLPIVIGELTGPWVKAEGAWDALRKSQAAVAQRPEFKNDVLFVPTHDFVRKPEDSPNPGHGHHEFGNAETYLLVGDALGRSMLELLKRQEVESKRIQEPKIWPSDPPTPAPSSSASLTTVPLPRLTKGPMRKGLGDGDLLILSRPSCGCESVFLHPQPPPHQLRGRGGGFASSDFELGCARHTARKHCRNVGRE